MMMSSPIRDIDAGSLRIARAILVSGPSAMIFHSSLAFANAMISSTAPPTRSLGPRRTSTSQSQSFPWDLAKKGSRTRGRSAQRQRRMKGAEFMKSRIHRALSYTRPSSTFPLTVVIVVTSNPDLMANMIARASSHQGSESMRNGQREVMRAKMNEYGISPGETYFLLETNSDSISSALL